MWKHFMFPTSADGGVMNTLLDSTYVTIVSIAWEGSIIEKILADQR